MKKYLFLLLLIPIISYLYGESEADSLDNKEYCAKFKISFQWILSRNGLNMREKPSLSGKVIKALPFSTRISVYLTNKIPATIGRIKGNWVRISTWGNDEGWVFDHYLGSAKQLFSTKDGKYGEYRYLKSWQSGHLLSINLHTNGTYTYIYQSDLNLVSKLIGRFYMNDKRVILYKPYKIIKAGGMLDIFPMRFRFEVKYDLIALMGKKVNFYKYPNQSY